MCPHLAGHLQYTATGACHRNDMEYPVKSPRRHPWFTLASQRPNHLLAWSQGPLGRNRSHVRRLAFVVRDTNIRGVELTVVQASEGGMQSHEYKMSSVLSRRKCVTQAGFLCDARHFRSMALATMVHTGAS
uniref:Uncharacterized protein n=1 Tax=Photinus pyralis TaxID=7054 RepID=A0A1Y1LVT7_PHOPY